MAMSSVRLFVTYCVKSTELIINQSVLSFVFPDTKLVGEIPTGSTPAVSPDKDVP